MDNTCQHPPRQAISGEALSSALQRAATICAEEGEKWTKPRERVYEMLLERGGPVKAYDLMPAFAEGRTAKPPTVYRALEFLEQIGLAHRIPSLNAYAACGGGARAHTASFLICDCCGSAQEIQPSLDSVIAKTTTPYGFRPSTTTLEIRGRCQLCLS